MKVYVDTLLVSRDRACIGKKIRQTPIEPLARAMRYFPGFQPDFFCVSTASLPCFRFARLCSVPFICRIGCAAYAAMDGLLACSAIAILSAQLLAAAGRRTAPSSGAASFFSSASFSSASYTFSLCIRLPSYGSRLVSRLCIHLPILILASFTLCACEPSGERKCPCL